MSPVLFHLLWLPLSICLPIRYFKMLVLTLRAKTRLPKILDQSIGSVPVLLRTLPEQSSQHQKPCFVCLLPLLSTAVDLKRQGSVYQATKVEECVCVCVHTCTYYKAFANLQRHLCVTICHFLPVFLGTAQEIVPSLRRSCMIQNHNAWESQAMVPLQQGSMTTGCHDHGSFGNCWIDVLLIIAAAVFWDEPSCLVDKTMISRVRSLLSN